MKIAVNTRFLIKGKIEGIGRFTFEVLKRLVKDHPQDEFIFFFDRPYDPSFVLGENVKPVVLFPPARHPLLFIWWFEGSLARALKKYKPDVFLSPDNFTELRSGTPSVLVIHDLAYMHFPEQVSWLQRNYYRYFTPKFIRKADRIVTVSEFTRSDVVKHFSASINKIDVACNGCDSRFIPMDQKTKREIRNQWSDGAPYFLFIGAIQPRKNVHRLITAFDQFKKRAETDHKLLLIGRWAWQTGEVKDAWEKTSYKDDIIFLGYLPHKTMGQILAASYALVYASLFEGFGIPLLEAMHCDVPVITSNVSSMPEVAGKAAILVDPVNTAEITDAMYSLWNEPDKKEQLIAAGRQQRKKFSWEKATAVVWQNLQLASEKE